MNSSFHPVGALRPASRGSRLRDSIRASFVLLRYGSISLATAAIDNLIFFLVFHATGTIAGAQAAARTVSVIFNYSLVRRAVFASTRKHRVALPRYLLLAVVNVVISYSGIRLLTSATHLGVFAAKITTETFLFIANFVIQRALIFSSHPFPETPSAL